MEYRLTVQHNKNDNEQSVTIINDRGLVEKSMRINLIWAYILANCLSI